MECLFCSGDGRPFVSVEREEFGKNTVAEYARCTYCGSVFQINPKPNDSIYDETYFEKFKGFAESGESDGLCSCRVHTIKSLIDVVKNIMDFGCGAGDFLAAASRSFSAKATGIEINRDAANYLIQKYPEIEVFASLFEWAKQTEKSDLFQVITAYDSLEHLIHPERFINIANKMLTPGGLLVISTPYLPENIFPEDLERWRHCRPVEHFNHPTKKGLLMKLSELGFDHLWSGFPEDEFRKPGGDCFEGKNILTVVGLKR